METVRALNIPPPRDENDFESLCLALWKRILGDPHTQLNGRRGQRQNGVDIFGRSPASLQWTGIQCKVRNDGNVTRGDLEADSSAARLFNPKLAQFCFATTARRDAAVQEVVRTLSDKSVAANGPSIAIWSWDDIREELNRESNIDILQRFYRGLLITSHLRDITVGRVLSIETGVEGFALGSAHYEITLGRTAPGRDPERCMGLEYRKGVNFIANWNELTFDSFPFPIFPTDLEYVFRRNPLDRFIMSKWLSSLGESLDSVLYGEREDHSFRISWEEYEAFVRALKEEREGG